MKQIQNRQKQIVQPRERVEKHLLRRASKKKNRHQIFRESRKRNVH